MTGPADPLEAELERIARHLEAELGEGPPAPIDRPSSPAAMVVVARFFAAFLVPALIVVAMAAAMGGAS